MSLMAVLGFLQLGLFHHFFQHVPAVLDVWHRAKTAISLLGCDWLLPPSSS